MVIVNSLFDGTPLAQTYIEMQEVSRDEYSGCYTPYRIQSWNFGYYPNDSVDVAALYLHEVAHVIDLWRRGKYERLLQSNYGMSFAGFNRTGLRVEALVFTIQDRLSWALFKKAIPMPLLSTFQGGDKHLTEAEWNKMWMEIARKECRGHTLDSYYKDWQDACAYIAENRNYSYAQAA